MEHANATQYARQLAKYIKDPSTILARVRDYYDTDVPTLKQIKRILRQANPKPRVADPKGKEYRERESDGEDFVVKGLVKLTDLQKAEPALVGSAPVKAPWPVWYRTQIKMRAGTPISSLLASVCEFHALTREQVLGPDRHMVFVDARRIIATVLKARGWSYPSIGRMLGGRDHTTIINLCRKMEPRMNQCEFLRASYDYHMAEFGQHERLAA